MSQHRNIGEDTATDRSAMSMRAPFRFRQFSVTDRHCGHRIGTDAILLAAWVREFAGTGPSRESHHRVLDIGTGCGVMALILAQRFPSARIDAIEVDAGAAAEAADNFRRSPWSDRLRVIHASYDCFAKAAKSQLVAYDAVVCNPPFFSRASTSRDPRRRQARHTETLDWQTVMSGCAALLTSAGTLNLILPASEESSLRAMASQLSGSLTRLCRVAPREGMPANRILVAFAPQRSDSTANAGEVTSLAIRQRGNANYTDAFWAVCQDYYLPSTAHAPRQ